DFAILYRLKKSPALGDFFIVSRKVRSRIFRSLSLAFRGRESSLLVRYENRCSHICVADASQMIRLSEASLNHSLRGLSNPSLRCSRRKNKIELRESLYLRSNAQH